MQTARESHIPGAAPPLTAGSSGSVVSLDASQSEIWDDFCRRNDDAWFWHTTKWLDYTLDYRPELSPRSHSFLFLVNGKPAAICPLVLETSVDTGHAVRQFSFGGDAVPAPVFADELSEKLRKSVKKSVYAHIDELARKHQVHRIAFRSAPLAPSFWTKTSPQPNPFLREGFSDISLLTQIVDLSQDEPQLFRELRNDHQRDILRVEKSLEITIFDQSTITAEQFERYRSLHRKAAGRTTRPASTFAMMHQWIRDGLAILSCATLQGQDVGFTLTNIYKDGAYYSSGCNDPDVNLTIGHLLHWRTMLWLKARGIRRYETGIQLFASQPHTIVSKKDWNISYFKRGFGGTTVPFWRGEKFYEEEFCKRILAERTLLYSQSMFSGAAS